MNKIEPIAIDPNSPSNPGLDYYHLKREGTRLVQALSGGIWTDYNEHDPGVTTLEQLCYALTELSYRAEIRVEDFLTCQNGKIDAGKQALYGAGEILPCNPVTQDDYRKLLVDRVPQVYNAWLRQCPYGEGDEVGGLYQIAVYAPGLDHRCGGDRVVEVAREALSVYMSHRGLCEDAAGLFVLRPLPTEVWADVGVDDSQTAESMLAELYFQLGNTLAPELRRRSLDDSLVDGATPDRLFNGPLMLNGFIDDDQLLPKQHRFTARELSQALQRIPGVTGVRKLRFSSPCAGHLLGAPVGDPAADPASKSDRSHRLSVEPGQIPELRIHPSPPGDPQAFTLRLFKQGILLNPNPKRVELLLARRWTEYRRTYSLQAQYDPAFAMPEGRFRDFRAYESIQDQYPNVYGIGSFGLPSDALPARQAQAHQLKGYLLAFEQQLADFFAQLSRTKDLFSIDPELRRTYFFELLGKSVPNVEPLLRRRDQASPGYVEGLAQLVAGQDPYLERRNRFLDVMLGLYGERLEASEIAGGSDTELYLQPSCETDDCSPGQRRIDAKIALLRGLPESTSGRGRGFDTLGPVDESNHSGMQIKCRIQLGMPALDHPALTDALDELGLQLIDRSARSRPSIGRPLGRKAANIESGFTRIQAIAEIQNTASPSPSGSLAAVSKGDLPNLHGLPNFQGQTISSDFVFAASKVENLYLGVFPGETQGTIVCRCGAADRVGDDRVGDDGWRLLDRCENPARAWAIAHAWQRALSHLADSFSQLYLVEHVLLRWALDDDRPLKVPFDYSFTLSAVLSGPPEQIDDPEWRRFAREIVRDNAPAHLELRYVFLDPATLVCFEDLDWAWRRALNQPTARTAKAETSAAMRDFLVQHQESSSRGSRS